MGVNEKKNFIESDKIKLSVIILGAVVFLAYLKQYIFYRYFNLDISNYIEIQEVFTPYIYEMCYCIGYILFFLVLNNAFLQIVKSNSDTLSKPNGIRFFKYLWRSPVLFTMFIVNSIIIIYLFIVGHDSFQFYSIVLTSYLYLILTFILNDGNKVIIEYKEKNIHTIYILNVLLFMFYLNMLRINTAITFKRDKEFKETIYKFLLSDNKEIISDSLNIYLGRTKNNFFMYEPRDKKVKVYNTLDIKNEEIIKLE